jgi:hypothetical protein
MNSLQHMEVDGQIKETHKGGSSRKPRDKLKGEQRGTIEGHIYLTTLSRV